MASSTLAGATIIMIAYILFVIGCLAIPFYSFFRVIYKDWDGIFSRGTEESRMSREEEKMAKKITKWMQKDGKVIKVSEMSDQHLANSIRMITRAWADSKYLGKVTSNHHYKDLICEAKKRGFQIT